MPDLVSPTTALQAIADKDRLAALRHYGILDTPPEQGFDEVVQIATLVCDAPIALVSLVADNRQWFKAKIGFPHCQTDLDRSVCAYALTEPDLLVIPDLLADPRTRDNPLVTGEPHIRFYAGAPLRDRSGNVLGSVCVIDKVPRPAGLTTRQAEVLRSLSRQVMGLLDLRASVSGRDSFIAHRRQLERRMGEDHARLQISEAHWRRLFERLNEGFVVAEVVRNAAGQATDWRFVDVNEAWGELVGIEPATVVGQTIRSVFPGIEDEWVHGFTRVVETGEAIAFTRKLGPVGRWYEGRVFPLADSQFAVLFLEVTERVRADIRRNALLEIGDALRDLTSTQEMTAKASAIVGQALDAGRVGFGRIDPDGEHVVVDPDWTAPGIASIAGRHRFEHYGNIRQELLLGEPLVIGDVLVDPRTAADPAPLQAIQVRSLVNIPIQERGRTVAIFVVHDTKTRDWTAETIDFLRNIADRLSAGVARLKAEADQQLLNQELSHRMKNMLAMVQAIATQTLKGVAEQGAVDAFRQRLHALSSAHDVLLQQSWSATPLGEVVRAVLERSCRMDQVTVSGSYVVLGPRATLSVSLLLHELATNAVKYGALSVEAGQVGVAWHVDPAAAELVFTWKEANGPPAGKPSRAGFGSRLIRAGLLGTGGVDFQFLPSGLTVEMRASIEQVQTA